LRSIRRVDLHDLRKSTTRHRAANLACKSTSDAPRLERQCAPRSRSGCRRNSNLYGKFTDTFAIAINPAFTTGGAASASSTTQSTDNIVRLGLSYQFNR